jgi:hypothetical protein
MPTGDPIELLLKQAFPAPTGQAYWEAQLLRALYSIHLAPVTKLALPAGRSETSAPPHAEAA